MYLSTEVILKTHATSYYFGEKCLGQFSYAFSSSLTHKAFLEIDICELGLELSQIFSSSPLACLWPFAFLYFLLVAFLSIFKSNCGILIFKEEVTLSTSQGHTRPSDSALKDATRIKDSKIWPNHFPVVFCSNPAQGTKCEVIHKQYVYPNQYNGPSK